ncbi:MAG: hypothetical protein LBE85_03405 [Candidatus Accumulibacter sp.]|jgi:hypothetical protein|nr:hypothetical protein [Accumulibacter sp.]
MTNIKSICSKKPLFRQKNQSAFSDSLRAVIHAGNAGILPAKRDSNPLPLKREPAPCPFRPRRQGPDAIAPTFPGTDGKWNKMATFDAIVR